MALISTVCSQAFGHDLKYDNNSCGDLYSSERESSEPLSQEGILKHKENLDKYLDEQYEKCLNDEDCLEFLEEPVIESVPLLPSLSRCLRSCASGTAAIQAFCRSVWDPRVRAACWAVQFASYPACAGFCYWYF